MKAAIQHKNGDPTSEEVLSVLDDVAIPDPKEGEILVKVMCASLNPIDYKFVSGDFPGRKEGAFGSDVSGFVEKIGPNYDGSLKVGDKVYADAMKTKGSFAEYVVVQSAALGSMPKNLTFKETAALPLAGLTALQALQTQGGLQKDQKVAILGGSGGVGSLAVQMAKALGAGHIYATGSSVDMIKGLGADTVFNYREVSVVESMKGLDLDIVFDTVGGDESLQAAQAGLKKGGTFVTILGRPSPIPSITCKGFLTNTNAPEVTTDMMKITELVEAGKVKPVVDERDFELTTTSLHDIIKASMTHRTKGKLVLTVAKE